MVHWCRQVMDEVTGKLVEAMNHPAMDAMEISGGRWGNKGWRSFVTTNYPEFDICEYVSDMAQFDVIFAEQVFEHLAYPYRAARNVYQLLRPRGFFLVTTPFLIKVHPCPIDCTRWTEQGMQYFLTEAGFNEIETYSWGNRECVVANFEDWVDYNPNCHSLENEPDFPLVIWALARKD